ncbi:hypothetical protein [Pseudomonas benzenivorans]|uniref:hypothetical protein n=1 Tax=Pseudomonas benzenivorans TaxID=556533 RepID=UPI003516C3C7
MNDPQHLFDSEVCRATAIIQNVPASVAKRACQLLASVSHIPMAQGGHNRSQALAAPQPGLARQGLGV